MRINSREINGVIILFFLSLIIRGAYSFVIAKHYFFYGHPGSDVTYYQNWAHAIVLGQQETGEAFKGLPLYPYFLAFLYRLAFGHWEIVRFFHLVLGSINVVLAFRLAQKVFTDRIAVLTGILCATNFLLIFYDWLMMPVPLLVFIGLVVLNSVYSLAGTLGARQWFFLGIILGGGIVGDGKFFLFFLGLIPWILLRTQHPRGLVLKRLILPLFIGTVVFPGLVMTRNILVSQDIALISSHSGINFYIGNHRNASGLFENPEFIRPDHTGIEDDTRLAAEEIAQKKLTPGQASRFWQHRALQFIGSHPAEYLGLLAKKFFAFFTEQEAAYEIDMLLMKRYKDLWDINSLSMIFPLSILGMALALYRRENAGVMILMILGQLVFTLLFFLLDRHRASVLPVFIIFESYALCWLIEQFQSRRFKMFFAGFLLVILGFLILKPKTIDPLSLKFLTLSKAGPIFDEKGQYLHAQRLYREALSLRPLDANTLYNLGTSLSRDGKYDQAVQELKRARDLNRFDVNIHYNLAFTYEQLGQYHQSSESYKKALSINPRMIEAYFRLAEIHKILGRCDEAIKFYSKIPPLSPRHSEEITEYINQCR